MQKQLADDIYVKCDILTGRAYRCVTALFQDFLDIRLSAVYGERWIEQIVTLCEDLTNGTDGNNRSLRSLVNKRNRLGLKTLDKTSVDVTLANSLILYNCYYLTAVPKFVPERDKMLSLLRTTRPAGKQPTYATQTKHLSAMLDAEIAKNVLLLKYIQPEKLEIKNTPFFSLVTDLVQDKNELNSHMSETTSPIKSDSLILNMELHMQNFLDYLRVNWDTPEKESFLEKYDEQVEILEYLRYCDGFGAVTAAMNSLMDGFYLTRNPASGTAKPDTVPGPAPDKKPPEEHYGSKGNDTRSEQVPPTVITAETGTAENTQPARPAEADAGTGTPILSDLSADAPKSGGAEAAAAGPEKQTAPQAEPGAPEPAGNPPADGRGGTSAPDSRSAFSRALELISREDLDGAVRLLAEETENMADPRAPMLLAFLCGDGRAAGHTNPELIITASMLSDPEGWLDVADDNRDADPETALAYYIGYAIRENDLSGYSNAGYAALKLRNFRLTRECFRLAGQVDPTTASYYRIFSRMTGRDEFLAAADALERNHKT